MIELLPCNPRKNLLIPPHSHSPSCQLSFHSTRAQLFYRVRGAHSALSGNDRQITQRQVNKSNIIPLLRKVSPCLVHISKQSLASLIKQQQKGSLPDRLSLIKEPSNEAKCYESFNKDIKIKTNISEKENKEDSKKCRKRH